MTVTTAERVRLFRSKHPIPVTEEYDPDIGRIYRCAIDGLRVQPMRDGRWRHDSAAVLALLDAEYGGPWGRVREVERIAEQEYERDDLPEFQGVFK